MGHALLPSWESALRACRHRGGRADELVVAPPASERLVESTEGALGQRLPGGLRRFFLEDSARVDVRWFLPESIEPPFRDIFSGELSLDLSRLPHLANAHAGWLRECFGNPGDAYDAVWHNKFAFMEVGNGDFLSISCALPDGPVIYLSHDDGEGHGRTLAPTFRDFLLRYSALGCVGSEDWQWLHFCGPSGELDPSCPNAVRWREWFGLGEVSNRADG